MCNRSSLDRGTSGTHRRCPTLPPPSCMHPSSHPATRCWGPLSPHSPPGPGSFLRDALHLGMTGGPRGWAQAQAGRRSGPALSSAGNWGAMPPASASAAPQQPGRREGDRRRDAPLPAAGTRTAKRLLWCQLPESMVPSQELCKLVLQHSPHPLAITQTFQPRERVQETRRSPVMCHSPSNQREAPASSQGTHGATGAAVVGSGPTHSDHVP